MKIRFGKMTCFKDFVKRISKKITNDFIMDKTLLFKIKHLPKDQQYILIALMKEDKDIAQTVQQLESDEEVTIFFEKIKQEVHAKNDDSFAKILKEYTEDIKTLKNKQDSLLVEDKIIQKMEN